MVSIEEMQLHRSYQDMVVNVLAMLFLMITICLVFGGFRQWHIGVIAIERGLEQMPGIDGDVWRYPIRRDRERGIAQSASRQTSQASDASEPYLQSSQKGLLREAALRALYQPGLPSEDAS